MIAESLLLSTRDFLEACPGLCYNARPGAAPEVQDIKNIATFTILLQKTHTDRSTIDKVSLNAQYILFDENSVLLIELQVRLQLYTSANRDM